jgi:hypothetical protein
MSVRPYYEDGGETGLCACGCGQLTGLVPQTIRRLGLIKGQRRKYVNGHNFRGIAKTPAHLRAIAEGQKLAWETKRGRMPVGSKRLDRHGYVLVKTREGGGRWDKEHVIVVEREIGRRLFPDEVVHHINAVKSDNRPENLYLCRTMSEHGRSHASLNRLIASLLDEGTVTFNRTTGEYER